MGNVAACPGAVLSMSSVLARTNFASRANQSQTQANKVALGRCNCRVDPCSQTFKFDCPAQLLRTADMAGETAPFIKAPARVPLQFSFGPEVLPVSQLLQQFADA